MYFGTQIFVFYFKNNTTTSWPICRKGSFLMYTNITIIIYYIISPYYGKKITIVLTVLTIIKEMNEIRYLRSEIINIFMSAK